MSELNSSISLFKAVLQVVGPCLFLGLQLSCISVAFGIQRLKSVRKLSSIPFASLLACGFVWAEYGWLKNDRSVWVPNAIAILTALFCMQIYYKYALLKPILVYFSVMILILLGAMLGIFNQITLIGLVGCAMSVVMSGSPLAVISTVIKEQSTASLPFWTSFVTWLNSLSWVLYGHFVVHDPMILLPNALGLLLASAQMCLFWVYGFSAAESSGAGLGGPKSSSASSSNLADIEDMSGLLRDYKDPSYSV